MRSLRAPPAPGRLLLWVVVVLLLVLGGLPSTSAQRRRPQLDRCQRPPRFQVNSVEPMTLTHGHVTVVALLTHTCGFCQRQAAGLDRLQREYRVNGTDVRMFIVNGGAAGYGEYRNVTEIPVYQDDNQEQIWRLVYKGVKDDIFIFNRCGMMTYRIGMPYAFLGFNYVRRAIHNTLHHPICPHCTDFGSDPHDVMMGDAPALPNHLAGRKRNRSRCPAGDQLCRELRRARRRWNRLRRQQGMGHLSEEQAVRLFSHLHLGGNGAGPPL